MSSAAPILRCLVLDDEPFAVELLSDDIRKIPFLQLINTSSSPTQALALLKEQPVDLLFLDIQMPVMKGTDLLRALPAPPLVIMTTAYDHYAVEGFELNVVDYLVKPIPFDRFQKAVQRAYELYCLKNPAAAVPAEPASIFVYAEYKEVKILLSDILYIEGLKDYVKIFIDGQTRPVLTRMNLKAMEARLPEHQFCRIHNSYIISLSRIDGVQKSQLFIGTLAIPIGDKFADTFRKRYHGT